MGSELNIDDEISTVFSRKMIVKINFVIEIYTIGNVKKKKNKNSEA